MNKIEYNKAAWGTILKEKNISMLKIQKALNMGNNITIKRWINGEDCYVSRICEFCTTFGVDLLDFFFIDDQPAIEFLRKKLEKEVLESPIIKILTGSQERNETNYIEEISKLEKQIILLNSQLHTAELKLKLEQTQRELDQIKIKQDITSLFQKKLAEKDQIILSQKEQIIRLETKKNQGKNNF